MLEHGLIESVVKNVFQILSGSLCIVNYLTVVHTEIFFMFFEKHCQHVANPQISQKMQRQYLLFNCVKCIKFGRYIMPPLK